MLCAILFLLVAAGAARTQHSQWTRMAAPDAAAARSKRHFAYFLTNLVVRGRGVRAPLAMISAPSTVVRWIHFAVKRCRDVPPRANCFF
jgi:hypothetical protein